MHQTLTTWHHVEILLQLYWNLMETLPSKTSTHDINFWCQSLKITHVSHYLSRLKTNVDTKKSNEVTPTVSLMDQNAMQCHDATVFWATEATEQDLVRPMGLLFKPASYYSLHYMNNPQLTHSVCLCSLGIFSRYSGNWRKSQEQKQTSCDITHVLWAQKVSRLH